MASASNTPYAGERGAPPEVFSTPLKCSSNQISSHPTLRVIVPKASRGWIIAEQTLPYNPFWAIIILSGGQTHPFGGYEGVPFVPEFVRFRVMVQGREALYTHDHGYDSDCLSPLRQRKHHSQRDDLQLQAALLVQGLRQEFPRGSPTQRLHRPKAWGDPARLPGEVQPARAFAYLGRLTQYRDELARKKSQALPELSETLAEPDPEEDREATTLELLDELCARSFSKGRKDAGSGWRWLALCRETRQVVAYYIGDRSEQSCRELWERVPEAYRGGYCYSDFWKAYREVVRAEQHTEAGKESGETAHVERWNNTLRQRLSRFVRKSLSFSKRVSGDASRRWRLAALSSKIRRAFVRETRLGTTVRLRRVFPSRGSGGPLGESFDQALRDLRVRVREAKRRPTGAGGDLDLERREPHAPLE